MPDKTVTRRKAIKATGTIAAGGIAVTGSATAACDRVNDKVSTCAYDYSDDIIGYYECGGTNGVNIEDDIGEIKECCTHNSRPWVRVNWCEHGSKWHPSDHAKTPDQPVTLCEDFQC